MQVDEFLSFCDLTTNVCVYGAVTYGRTVVWNLDEQEDSMGTFVVYFSCVDNCQEVLYING